MLKVMWRTPDLDKALQTSDLHMCNGYHCAGQPPEAPFCFAPLKAKPDIVRHDDSLFTRLANFSCIVQTTR